MSVQRLNVDNDTIQRELESVLVLLGAFVAQRVESHFSLDQEERVDANLAFLGGIRGSATPLSQFVRSHELPEEAQHLLLLALAPHIRADFLDQVIQRALPKAGDFPQIGGSRGKSFRGFLPTGETALFVGRQRQ